MKNKNRKGIEYPKDFMKVMKSQKKKKIRKIPIDEEVIEQKFNNAERIL